MLQMLFGLLMLLTAIFLILLVLVQRGRGGGLAGAFGGMGGASAFGAKAGDTFTKITIWAATFWILLCMASIVVLNRPERKLNPGGTQVSSPTSRTTEEVDEKEEPAGSGAAASGGAAESSAAGSGTSGASTESTEDKP